MPLKHPATRTDSPFTAQSSKFKIQSVHRVMNGRIFKPFETSAIVRREDRREQELGQLLLRQIRHSNPLCFLELKLEQLYEKEIARQIGNEMLVNKARRYRPYWPRSLSSQKKETKKDTKKEALEEWIRHQQREDQQEAQKRAQQFESLRQNRLTERKKREPFYMEPRPVQHPKQPYEREKFIHKAEKDTKKRAKELARFFLICAMEREAGAYQLIMWEQQREKVPAEEWLKKNMALVAKIPGMPRVPPSRLQSQGRPSSGQYARNSTNGARMPQHLCTGWIFDGLNANGNAKWYCVRDDDDPLLAQRFTQQPFNSGPQPQPHNPSVPSDTSSHPNPRGPRGYAAQNIGREDAGHAAGEQGRQKEAANTSIQDSFSQQREAPEMIESSGRAYAESMRQQQDAGRTAYEAEHLHNQGNAPSSRNKYLQQKGAQEEAARAARDQPRRQNFESSREAFRHHCKARRRKEWADRVDAENARQQQEAAQRAYAEGARQQQNRPREPAGWAYQENLRTQERIRQANLQREEAQRRFEEGKRQQRQEQQEWERRNGRRSWDGRTPNNQFPFTFPNSQRPTAQHQNPQPIQRWEAYQAAWEKVTVGSDFPWPVQTNRSQNISPTTVNHFYTSAFSEKSHRVAVLNKERKRWHPDKVEQKVGKLGGTTLNTVKDVFQIVDELFGRETGRQVRSTGLKEN